MNELLLAFYEGAHPAIVNASAAYQGISWPLFIEVPPNYSNTQFRLMIVGQQTNGWGHEQPQNAAHVVQLYHDFNLGHGYPGPFWAAAHTLFRFLHPSGPPRSFLWSNLVKLDQNGQRPASALEEAVSQLGLLPREVAVTQPGVVVFFTGPRYDQRLQATFAGAHLEPENGQIARVQHGQLPPHSYRTYHPNYLLQSGHWDVLHQLADLILGQG